MKISLHIKEDSAYLIREHYDGDTFVSCEYGQLIDGQIRWFTTYRGVKYDQIEPFAAVDKDEDVGTVD